MFASTPTSCAASSHSLPSQRRGLDFAALVRPLVEHTVLSWAQRSFSAAASVFVSIRTSGREKGTAPSRTLLAPSLVPSAKPDALPLLPSFPVVNRRVYRWHPVVEGSATGMCALARRIRTLRMSLSLGTNIMESHEGNEIRSPSPEYLSRAAGL
ncbi:hypothetical protein OBBRIDRAFT_889710 [Obba rivulosa]|uniref:Uncharacterized protein n=1 Tax=Obba rivulosa TaxID=1052685 RepID=A0A8E2DJ70_9APHY|nr:hypothetical protein OBBRIDRAFT_889710 [Obba rivulosa]